MKNLLKDIWFHIRYFIVRSFRFVVINTLFIAVMIPFIITLFGVLEIIFLGFGCYDCLIQLGDEPILTEEEISDKKFYYAMLGLYTLGFLISSLLLYLFSRLSKKMRGPKYFDYDEEEVEKEEKEFF